MEKKKRYLPKCKQATIDEYRLGTFRSSMDNNPLLKKPELGKSTRRYSLPSYLNKDFIYGKANYSVDGGVAEALIHKDISRKQKKVFFPQNFVKLNAGAIKAGLVTSKEHAHYRAVTDIKMTSPEMRKLLYGGIWPELCHQPNTIPHDMVFGISTRPSTPIFDIIENKFQLKWLHDMREVELAERAKKVDKEKHMAGYQTKTSLLRKFLPPIKVPNTWKMQKYKKIRPHLETFESAEKRRAAFEKHEMDAISRRGIFGHGIYEPAKIQ